MQTYGTRENRYLDAARSAQGNSTHARPGGNGISQSLCGVKVTGRLNTAQPLKQVTCQRCRKAMRNDGTAAAQYMGDWLRAKNTIKRDPEDTGPVWDRIIADEQRYLDEIAVFPCWDNAPAVGWEVGGTEWAIAAPWDLLEEAGYNFYMEPYYSFLGQLYSLEG